MNSLTVRAVILTSAKLFILSSTVQGGARRLESFENFYDDNGILIQYSYTLYVFAEWGKKLYSAPLHRRVHKTKL